MLNKIIVVDDNIELLELSDSVKVELIPKNILFDVNTLKIDILNDTTLNIDYKHLSESKLNIEINISDNVKCNINEFREGNKSKIKYHYNINLNSILNIYKFYDIDTLKEFVRIDLNRENATINYNFKTVSNNIQKYDLTIYHNHSKTFSNINNNGVNINNGLLTFNVSSFVPNGNKECEVLQKSRIVNLTSNKCVICPNLYIDEYDINASHSAYVGSFSDDELFYLMSRGIDKEEAEFLLIRGFLLNDMEYLSEKIDIICEKYWR